jgi:hypothetical protein
MNPHDISVFTEREHEHVRFFEGICFVLSLYGVVGLILLVLPS